MECQLHIMKLTSSILEAHESRAMQALEHVYNYEVVIDYTASRT